MQYEQIKRLFADMGKEKLKILTGGLDMDRPGYFVKPTIIDNPPDICRVVVEEPFGKVTKSLQQLVTTRIIQEVYWWRQTEHLV
jgi:acyl-CoA reductase-like NAD-dependent aldehyde dehydrogenase